MPAAPTRDPPAARRLPRSGSGARPAPGVPGTGSAGIGAPAHDQEVLDRLATMVAVVRVDASCLLVNAALENALRQSRRRLVRTRATGWFEDPLPLQAALEKVAAHQMMVSRFEGVLCCLPPDTRGVPVNVIVSPTGRDGPHAAVMIEMIEIARQRQFDREARLHGGVQAHRELLRNLAHEIRNPLGGIRGAAQLLALESASQSLTDYTDVIIREADRLQTLVDRLLSSGRSPSAWADLNIHDVCERVRMLVTAEFPVGLQVQRDYDPSLPGLRGDREQLIQALLNIVRNAAKALAARIAAGDARIVLRTRAIRQATVGGRHHRLAIQVQVEDNGPGVPEALREQIFQPLVSGDPAGHGLGLTLAQTLVQQHGGALEFDSRPGLTRFTMLLPLDAAGSPGEAERMP